MKFSDFSGLPNMGAAHQGPLTVGAAAGLLTALLAGAALHKDTRFVLVTVEAQPIRMTVNGTVPTSTLGFGYAAGAEILLSRAEAESARLIRSGGSDSAVQVSQYLE
jgi:hypothetical protein